MRPLEIYTDTSVLGGCLDEEFAHASNLLVDLFVAGRRRLFLSRQTLRELELAPSEVRRVLDRLPPEHIDLVEETQAAFALAERYLQRGAVPRKNNADAFYIPTASLSGAEDL